MPRPHIEFIQSQVLPFKAGLYGGARPKVETRILSFDDETGESSTQIRYPVGYARTEPEILLADEELFVLEGSIEINGQTYGKHFYAHLPKGYLRKTQGSKTGAVVLTFFSGEPKAEKADAQPDDFDESRLVEHLDTLNMEGMQLVGEDFNTPGWDPTGSVHKGLYQDPYTKERTWLVGMMPYWKTTFTEVHPCVEEEYSILGDLCLPNGMFRDGAYFWRPPGIEHGPFGTWGGTLHLCRARGGEFATEMKPHPGPTWHPDYDPVLPPEYQEHVRAAGDGWWAHETGY